MKMGPSVYFVTAVLVIGSPSCSNQTKTGATPSTGKVDAPLTELPIGTSVAIVAATAADCINGGVLLKSYKDVNGNGILDGAETVLSTTSVCNGANGSAGTPGVGAGIKVTPAALISCPAGGVSLTTFVDLNNNGSQESGENATSFSTVCNGTNGSNGSNGLSSSITTTLATSGQCPQGGYVYTTHTEGQSAEVSIVCNGTQGNDGSNANFQITAVGAAVPGHSFSACHHDSLYLPDSSPNARGWLIFRHQSNGAVDQGIGSTGFNVWNVDISDFSLASEAGGVNYCNVHWNPSAKLLNFTVTESTYGMAGQTGSIQY